MHILSLPTFSLFPRFVSRFPCHFPEIEDQSAGSPYYTAHTHHALDYLHRAHQLPGLRAARTTGEAMFTNRRLVRFSTRMRHTTRRDFY